MIKVNARSFRLAPMSISSAGIFDGETNVYGPLQKRWIAKATWAVQPEDDWRDWDGLLASLDGQVGRVRIYDPFRRKPRISEVAPDELSNFSDGATFSDGASFQNGFLPVSCVAGETRRKGSTDLLLTGLSANLYSALRRGDLFEVRQNGEAQDFSQLHIVTATANTDSAGRTRVYFTPGLRADVVADDMIVFEDAKALMRLASDDEGEINVTLPSHGNFGLSLVEILPRL